MKCRKPDSTKPGLSSRGQSSSERRDLPEKLIDFLTGEEIPFTNRDNIRQNILKFLIDKKGYLKADITVDRQIRFEMEGQQLCSPVDISIGFNKNTYMIWKCASGSLVTRQRQIIASARLLEDYLIPYAVVTNGKDLELLDTSSEKVIGTGFQSMPSRQELLRNTQEISLKPVNRRKLIYEQRILYTYDAMSCPIGADTSSSPRG